MTSNVAGPGTSWPDQIYIIRHGEKPADPAASDPQSQALVGPPFGVDVNGNQSNHSLLPRGWQRSGALAALFDPALGPPQAGLRVPGTLFSPDYGNPTKTQGHRTYETISGLSVRLGIAIDSPVAEGSEPALAHQVITTCTGVVLICWEHQHIPALAGAFPTAAGTQIPAAWPGDRFDVIWALTSAPGAAQAEYAFSQIPQQLLQGDTDTVIS